MGLKDPPHPVGNTQESDANISQRVDTGDVQEVPLSVFASNIESVDQVEGTVQPALIGNLKETMRLCHKRWMQVGQH